MRRDITVTSDWNNRSLRAFLEVHFPNVPPKGLRRAIQRGQILVDGQRVSSNHIVSDGQLIAVHIQTSFAVQRDLRIEVIYEDEFIAALNKPAGHAISDKRGKGFAESAKAFLRPSTEPDALPSPAVLHRLDKSTSGVLLFAKTRQALQHLSNQFQQHTIKKEYRAWVVGLIEQIYDVDISLDGKSAFTRVIPLATSLEPSERTEVQLLPLTGRTHQLRRHMDQTGHAIIGDDKYGSDNVGEELLLWAKAIEFTHPSTEAQVLLEAPKPSFFPVTTT